MNFQSSSIVDKHFKVESGSGRIIITTTIIILTGIIAIGDMIMMCSHLIFADIKTITQI